MKSSSLAERAQAVLSLANHEPGRAGPAAAAIVSDARTGRDIQAAAVGELAWGHVLLATGDAASAIEHLRRCRDLARRCGRADLVGEAAIKLANAVALLGRTRQALRMLDRAMPTLTGELRARAMSQRASNLHLLGDLPAASAAFAVAVEELRSANNPIALQRTLSNHGIALIELHEFDRADAVLAEAERIAGRLGRTYSIGVITENRAYGASLRGDVPRALALLDEATEIVGGLGGPLALLFQDRAELLLAAGVATEALVWATRAVEENLALHRFSRASEVRLVAATAALSAGDPAAAVAGATAAMREFGRQRRPAWVARCRLILMRADLAGGATSLGARQIRATVDTLATEGRPSEMVEAWVTAARLTTNRSGAGRRRQWLTAASRYSTRAVPATVRARGWFAAALLRIEDGRPVAAGAALRAGLRVLDEHAETLSATDLRARSAAAREELARTGLRLAVAGGRAAGVLAWVERAKASRVTRDVRPPSDPGLAALLAEVRAITSRSESGPEPGDPARIAVLENDIRDRYRRAPSAGADPGSAGIVRAGALRAAVGDQILLDFFDVDGALGVVVVDQAAVRIHRVASTSLVADLVDRVSFAVRRAAAGGSPGSRRAARELLAATVSRLESALAPALRSTASHGVVISPTGPLHDLPWSVLTSLAGRPITVTPSATAWFRGAPAGGQARGLPLVVAGPRLPGARSEAAAVAALHGVDALDDDATVDRVLAALPGTSLLHLSAHGRLSAENPLFSSVLLADGPLMVYDLEAAPQAPDTVVLASCDTARSQVCTGDELLGLAATLLRRGCSRLIAPVTPVPDRSTGAVMTALHRLLADGVDPAIALARVQGECRTDEHLGAVAAAFVCLGVDRSG